MTAFVTYFQKVWKVKPDTIYTHMTRVYPRMKADRQAWYALQIANGRFNIGYPSSLTKRDQSMSSSPDYQEGFNYVWNLWSSFLEGKCNFLPDPVVTRLAGTEKNSRQTDLYMKGYYDAMDKILWNSFKQAEKIIIDDDDGHSGSSFFWVLNNLSLASLDWDKYIQDRVPKWYQGNPTMIKEGDWETYHIEFHRQNPKNLKAFELMDQKWNSLNGSEIQSSYQKVTQMLKKSRDQLSQFTKMSRDFEEESGSQDQDVYHLVTNFEKHSPLEKELINQFNDYLFEKGHSIQELIDCYTSYQIISQSKEQLYQIIVDGISDFTLKSLFEKAVLEGKVPENA